jgi:hypothetical protein
MIGGLPAQFGQQTFCAGHILADKDQEGRTFAAVEAFAAPWSMRMTEIDAVGMYDSLFDMPFQYMMCMYNAPVNAEGMEGFHFHIEFFPPMRSKDKQQFLASSETGAGAHCNPTAPEEKAQELRAAYRKYITEAYK